MNRATMMRPFQLISITCATLLFCNMSFAEDWYQIEVIAFEYTHPNQGDIELWENQPGEPDWKAGINLTDEATGRARQKQEEATKAAAAPPPPPTPPPAPVPVHEVTYNEDGDEEYEPETPPPPPAAPVPPPAPVKPEPTGQKFVTVEEILTGQHEQAVAAPTTHSSGTAPLDFVALPASQYTMSDIERKLNKQGTYRILTHTAWRQAAFTGNNNEGVHIFGGRLLDHEGPIGARYEFEGLVALKSTRYLHLDVDTLLRDNSTKEQGSKFNSPADLDLLKSGHVYQAYRLDQSQRVRSNKVYYFDHPLMGVIVKISPYGG